MSVLMTKDNLGIPKNAGNHRERSPRQKGHSKSSSQQQHQNRESLKIVNEKNAANLQTAEEDSESENLSPLLVKNKKMHLKNVKKSAASNSNATVGPAALPQPIAALHMEGVHEPIDDTDTDLDELEVLLKYSYDLKKYALFTYHCALCILIYRNRSTNETQVYRQMWHTNQLQT